MQAVEKIRTEMAQKANNGYIQVVGQFLLRHLEASPVAAEQILVECKTIEGSLANMQAEARKKAIGGCAVLTDQEGFGIVLKYFGIDGAVTPIVETAQPVPTPTHPKPASRGIEFDVDLDDLLSAAVKR